MDGGRHAGCLSATTDTCHSAMGGAAAQRACAARATTETGRYVQPRRAAARKGSRETASGGTPCAALHTMRCAQRHNERLAGGPSRAPQRADPRPPAEPGPCARPTLLRARRRGSAHHCHQPSLFHHPSDHRERDPATAHRHRPPLPLPFTPLQSSPVNEPCCLNCGVRNELKCRVRLVTTVARSSRCSVRCRK